jgi:sugar lactone lactonase YvrE
VRAGEAVTFSVTASGPDLRYQWYKDTTPLAGAQGAAWDLPGARPEDAGAYTVAVSNPAGTVESEPALLEVAAPAGGTPAILSFAASRSSILKGETVSLSWEVTGATGIAIEPAVGSFTLAKGSVEVTPGATVTYLLRASHGNDSVTQEARVSVLEPFRISWLAAAQPILPWGGGSTTLAWALGGAPGSLALDGTSVLGTSGATVSLLQGRRTFTLSAGSVDLGVHATVQVAVQGIQALAGGGSGAGWKDGPAREAGFHGPSWVAADPEGNLYVSDGLNHTVRKVAAQDGAVTTLAGAAGQAGAADGQGPAARFRFPAGIAVFQDHVFVADSGNGTIRRIARDGTVETLAGQAGESGTVDARGADARFVQPEGLAVDTQGNLYVADSGAHVIRRLDPAGQVTTLAGLAQGPGMQDGQGTGARFKGPRGLAVDPSGTVYVADAGNKAIRRIDPLGGVTTLAAAGGFLFPVGIVLGLPGQDGLPTSLVVSDGYAQTLRSLDLPSRQVTPLAGNGPWAGYQDGQAPSARFNAPQGLALLSSGALVVADRDNHLLRTWTPGEGVATLAGTAPAVGWKDGQGQEARFDLPGGIALGPDGTVYVADSANHVVRRVTPAGGVDTLAGRPGSPGDEDGQGDTARFDFPAALALDASGTLFVADLGNGLVRTVSPDGTVGTLAGLRGRWGCQDGSAAEATFQAPAGVALGPAGTLLVADPGSHTIRQVSPGGVVSTLAGQAFRPGFADGPVRDARFDQPCAIAVDDCGRIWVGMRATGPSAPSIPAASSPRRPRPPSGTSGPWRRCPAPGESWWPMVPTEPSDGWVPRGR